MSKLLCKIGFHKWIVKETLTGVDIRLSRYAVYKCNRCNKEKVGRFV